MVACIFGLVPTLYPGFRGGEFKTFKIIFPKELSGTYG